MCEAYQKISPLVCGMLELGYFHFDYGLRYSGILVKLLSKFLMKPVFVSSSVDDGCARVVVWMMDVFWFRVFVV